MSAFSIESDPEGCSEKALYPVIIGILGRSKKPITIEDARGGIADRPRCVDNVVDQDSRLVSHLSDDLHDLAEIRHLIGTPFIDDGQIRLEHDRKTPSPHHCMFRGVRPSRKPSLTALS